MFQGINCVNGQIANEITRKAFRRGLIIETSGADDHVIKLLCPLTIKMENLEKGLDIIEQAVKEVCRSSEVPVDSDYFNDVVLKQIERV